MTYNVFGGTLNPTLPTLFFICCYPLSTSLLFLFKNHIRSFRYVSLCLWNQLPASFRLPSTESSSVFFSLFSCQPSKSSSVLSSLSITPTLFRSKLKTYLSRNPSHHRPTPSIGLPPRTLDCSMVYPFS